MVVDDDKDILATITKGLRNMGFQVHGFSCNIDAVDENDAMVAMLNVGNSCLDAAQAVPFTNFVNVWVNNECSATVTVGTSNGFSIIVFDK